MKYLLKNNFQFKHESKGKFTVILDEMNKSNCNLPKSDDFYLFFIFNLNILILFDIMINVSFGIF